MPKIKEIADIFRGQQLTKFERLRISNNDESISEAVVINYDNILSYIEQPLLEDTFKIDNNIEKIYVDLKRKYKNTLIKPNDLVFPVKHKVHQVKIVNFEKVKLEGNYIYSNDLLIVRPDEEKINSAFLFGILNTKYIRDKLDNEALINKPSRITCEMIANLDVQIPDMKQQQKIIKELRQINLKKAQLENNFNTFINK